MHYAIDLIGLTWYGRLFAPESFFLKKKKNGFDSNNLLLLFRLSELYSPSLYGYCLITCVCCKTIMWDVVYVNREILESSMLQIGVCFFFSNYSNYNVHFFNSTNRVYLLFIIIKLFSV